MNTEPTRPTPAPARVNQGPTLRDLRTLTGSFRATALALFLSIGCGEEGTFPPDTTIILPTETPPAIPTDTPTYGNTPITPGMSPTPTVTETATPAQTVTETATPAQTDTETATPAQTDTETPTPTPTNTEANTPTPTDTEANTPTPTDTEANTPTPTDTETPTSTPTDTETPTSTPTDTETPTSTPIGTEVNTPTPTDTETPTQTYTVTPYGTPTPILLVDADGDGFPVRPEACANEEGPMPSPTGGTDAPTPTLSELEALCQNTEFDCDDLNPQVNPAAQEVCDDADLDEDCDGKSDDADASVDPESQLNWYEDGDGDGYGNLGAPVDATACENPGDICGESGMEPCAPTATDCNDVRGSTNPGAPEQCADTRDNDCDGKIDAQDPDCQTPTP